MIKITQYTRRAEARKLYAQDDQRNNLYFSIAITHSNGFYSCIWQQQTEELRTGYSSIITRPFDLCNGRTTLQGRRFSRGYLEKADKILAENLEKYFSIWKQEDYQRLCNEIHSDFANL